MVKKRISIFVFLISISIIFLGIGYAAIDNITLDLIGNASVKKNNSIEIISVNYLNDNQADINNSTINYFSNTMINSKIVLGSDENSTITYAVKLKNDTDNSYKFVNAIHDDNVEFYDNNNIEYTVTGITPGDLISSGEELVINLTFKYASNDISKNTLNSYINIKFKKVFEITYQNIEEDNLINFIEEDQDLNINFQNAPDEIVIDGIADYTYENGILNLSNIESNLIIMGKTITTLYTNESNVLSIGSTVNLNDFESEESLVYSPYLKYLVDSDNKVLGIDVCKKDTNNASSICLSGVNSSKYLKNKNLLIDYFGGTLNNIPQECIEQDNGEISKFKCENSYVIFEVYSNGNVVINDIENNKTCVIDSLLDTYSCN